MGEGRETAGNVHPLLFTPDQRSVSPPGPVLWGDQGFLETRELRGLVAWDHGGEPGRPTLAAMSSCLSSQESIQASRSQEPRYKPLGG